MINLPDLASLKAALTNDLEPRLRRLLTERLAHNQANSLTDMTHFLVVEAGDTEVAIIDAVGLSPLTNPLDGARFGSPAFHPFWDWLRRHDGWFELIVTVGNSGFAYVLLIEDSFAIDAEVRTLCLAHAHR